MLKARVPDTGADSERGFELPQDPGADQHRWSKRPEAGPSATRRTLSSGVTGISTFVVAVHAWCAEAELLSARAIIRAER